jgi:AAA domain, putative AbiEii toxin, Type IV TA system/AAA domain
MIRSFKAKNFRCFEELNLLDLRRLNIIVGKNASGKTALLEAIRLALGATPGIAITLNQYRGINFFPFPLKEQFEAQWNSFFWNFNADRHIITECEDSDGHRATLTMFYDKKRAFTPMVQQQAQTALLPTIVPVCFERIDFTGQGSKIYASVHPQGQGLNLEPGQELGLATEFFASSWFLNPAQNAQWLSQLSLENREQELVRAIREEFGFIQELTVLAPSQFGSSVYATVPFLSNKIPLSLVSAGINKFVTILAGILYRRGGVVLIDEIENGFYFERMPAFWTTILRLASEYDTQIFASTHSMECLRGLLPILKDHHENDVTLLRIERENGCSSATLVKGEFFEAALEQRFEVR